MCCLTNFLKAELIGESKVLALKESLGFLTHECGCDASLLEIRSDSYILGSWLKKDEKIFWDLKFTRNLL